MLMLPWCSSMQLVKLLVAEEQLAPQLSFWDCWEAAWGEASAGASALELPPNKPPMAWPTEEPMATPLYLYSC